MTFRSALDKLHLHFDVLKGVPLDADLTAAGVSEIQSLKHRLQPYVAGFREKAVANRRGCCREMSHQPRKAGSRTGSLSAMTVASFMARFSMKFRRCGIGGVEDST